MGADFLKDAYYSLEEKYYAVLDRIDKVIPVYKVIDPIDRIVPSFAILLCIIIFLLIVGVWFLLGLVLVKPTVGITLRVQNNAGDFLPNASVSLPALGKQFVTNSEGLTEKIELEKDSVVGYEISKRNFELKKGEFTADSTKVIDIVLVEQNIASLSKTVIIKDSLGRIILSPAHFSFACIGPGVPEPQETTVSNGSAKVLMPSTCKTLIANIEVAGFQSKQSVNITQNSQEIQLEELESELSTIKARVTFNNEPVPGIIVGLYEFSLGPLAEKTTDSAGLAEFKTPASNYQLKTKPTSEYGQKTSEEFTTQPGATVEKKIELKKDITALLTVQVLEKTTNKKISNASVTVKKENNVIDRKTTDSNGSVSFNLNALGTYNISADHSDYLVSERQVNVPSVGNFNESIVLEKYNGDNAATLKVKVLDAETQKGIKSARVALYYGQSEEKEGFLAPYTEQLTDINGIARFARVKPGTYYYAIAAKQGAFGRSDSQRFDLRNADSFYLNVSLVIPHGTVRVIARDTDGNPISNAKVSLFDAFDNSLIGSDLTDGNGVWVLSAESNYAKADKEVFVMVEKTALNPDEKDFASYITVAKPILPNAVQTFDITMQEKILGGNFKLVPLGLFKKDKQAGGINPAATPNLSAGQQYTAKFRIEVPAEKTYVQNILHVHCGKGDFGYGIMEKDSIVLKSINMPLSSNILKATSLDRSNGFDNDSATATSGDAKWANIAIAGLSPGIYEAEAVFEVKSNALVGEQIGIYSWLSGIIDGEEKFFPPMEAIPQDDFYVEPPQKQLFQVGVATLCDSEFCFNASIKEAVPGGLGESVEESFNAKILGSYKLTFNISNNSQTTIHNDAQLRVKNDDGAINFKEYSITLPSGRTVEGTNSQSELPNIDIKNSQNQNRFEKGAVIFGELLFTPQKSTNSAISFKIASSSDPAHTGLYSIVFQKDLTIIVSASNEFEVTATPEELAAGIENSIEVLVKDKKTGLEVENASVTAKDRFGNSLATGLTSRLGLASLKIPELLPGEEITLEISKPDYNLKELKLKANAKLLSAKPETISITINSTLEKEKTAELVLENVSAIPLKIEGMEFSGNSLNLLDDTAINNALAEQTGFELQPGDKKTVKFTAFLTQEGINSKQREQTEGVLIVKAGNSGSSWSLEIPVKTVIGFGAELDLQDCLQIMPKAWQTATEGKSVSYAFKIQNNCSSNGTPIALSNLEAKVQWEGNEIGSYLLSLHSSNTSGAIAAAELRQGYFKKLLESFGPETSLDALLTFTPYGGINGVANAKIIIQARNKAENSKEDQVLAQELATQISVVNLDECIAFSKDMLSIAKDPKLPESATDFAILNRKGCGAIKVLLSTLPSDSLNLSKNELIIPDGAVSEPIIVSAGKNIYPGQYSILVKAQLQGQPTASDITSTIEKDKTLRVRVFDTGLCIQLDKYEFNVWSDASIAESGIDNAELTNYCYEKKVPFKIDMKDLADSIGNAASQGSKGPCPLPALLSALGELLKGMGARGGEQTAAQMAGSQAALQGISQSVTGTTAAQNAVRTEVSTSCTAFDAAQKLYYDPKPEKGLCPLIAKGDPAGELQAKITQNTIANFAASGNSAVPNTELGANQPTASSSTQTPASKAIIAEVQAEAKIVVKAKIEKDCFVVCELDELCYNECIITESNHYGLVDDTFTAVSKECLTDKPSTAKPTIATPSTEPTGGSSTASGTGGTAPSTPPAGTNCVNGICSTTPNPYSVNPAPVEEKHYDKISLIAAEATGSAASAGSGSSQKSYFVQAKDRAEQAAKCFDALELTKAELEKVTGLAEPMTPAEIAKLLNSISDAELEQLSTKLKSLSEKITDSSVKATAIGPVASAAIAAKTTALATQKAALSPVSQFARPAAEGLNSAISNTETSLAKEQGIPEKATAEQTLLETSGKKIDEMQTKSITELKAKAETADYAGIAESLRDKTKNDLETERKSIEKGTHTNLGPLPDQGGTKDNISDLENCSFCSLTTSLTALDAAKTAVGTGQPQSQPQAGSPQESQGTGSTLGNVNPYNVFLSRPLRYAGTQAGRGLGSVLPGPVGTAVSYPLRGFGYVTTTIPRTVTGGAIEGCSVCNFIGGAGEGLAGKPPNPPGAPPIRVVLPLTGDLVLDSSGLNADSGNPYYGSPYGSPYGGIPNYGVSDPLNNFSNPYNSLYGGGVFGSNPLTQGMGTFLGNTLYDISSNETTGFSVPKPDIEIQGFEMYPVKLSAGTQLDSEISVEAFTNPVTDNRIDSTLMNESIGLNFTNNSPDSRGVFYKLLKVKAVRHYYNENKIIKPSAVKKGKVKIEERADSPKEASQYFLLQFNEIDPKTMGASSTSSQSNLDCTSFAPPGLYGNTGPEAAPKVLLDWSWNSIKSDSCDVENPNYVFCDGVQFSMEVLRKVQLIREFLAANKLVCPSETTAIGTKENTIESDDIGISKLYTDVVSRSGKSDINVIVSIENKAAVNLNTKLTVTVTNPATGASLPACVKQLNVVSKTTVGCEFSGLMQDNTAYTVIAGITPDLSNCSVTNCNSKTANDIVNSSFLVTVKPVLQICEGITQEQFKNVYNTSRLAEFIDATEKQGDQLTYPQGLSKEQFLKSLTFNSYLIQDRYSSDLQADFDDYYRNAFAQTPTWYKGSGDDPGLGVIFKDFSAFRIAPKFGEAPDIGYLLPAPGLYEASIEIEFGNENWQFFVNKQADVKVFVKLQKSPTQPSSLSPFYYLPFDGLVGTSDSEQGRTRYGLNYSGEVLNINAGPDILRTVGGASWSAFSDTAILNSSFINNFKTLNVDKRGQILSVERNKLVFSPSFATPAILKVENNNAEACASYNFGVNGVDTYLGMESNPWWGIGDECRDFDGSLMKDKWQNGIMDKSTATTGSWQTECGLSQTVGYGLEWPGVQKNFGKEFLKTIFYTPQKMQNSINIATQDDSAELITPSGSGKTHVALNGVGASAENLQAISEIIELVKQRQVCVSGESLEQVFWWNPTPVMNALADAEAQAGQECSK